MQALTCLSGIPQEGESHMGTRFLQHYLDSLGGLNTFG